jgi:hypothetical protein
VFRESYSATTASLLNTSLPLPHGSLRSVHLLHRLDSHSLFDDQVLRKRRIVPSAFLTKERPQYARIDFYLKEAAITG